jgi:hypothetical protein
MNYYKKYLKYKNKYLKIKGGGGEVITHLDESRFNIIKKEKVFVIIDKEYNNVYVYDKQYWTNENYHYFILMNDITRENYIFDDNFNINYNIKLRNILINKNIKINIKKLKNSFGCYKPYNFEKIINKINELNIQIKKKCENLKLDLINSFGYDDKIVQLGYSTDLILCLYYYDKCISSIILEINTNTNKITISSKTDKYFGNYKFNKLLRCIIILIGDLLICNNNLTKITAIKSIAVNHISAWLLISNFNVHIEDNDKLSTFESIKNLYDDGNELIITIPLSDENVEKAQQLFDKLVNTIGDDTIKCPTIEHQVAKSTVSNIFNLVAKIKSRNQVPKSSSKINSI